MSDIEPNEPQEQPEAPADEHYALIVKVQSWATPIVGLVMLVVGLLAGYFARPMLPGGAPAAVATPVVEASAPAPTQNAAALQDLMKYLIGQAKHFNGAANAPVTLIEFSDFQ